jgi:hypothetical protein
MLQQYYSQDGLYYIPVEEFDSVLPEVIDFLKANQDWALDYTDDYYAEGDEEHYFTLFNKREW